MNYFNKFFKEKQTLNIDTKNVNIQKENQNISFYKRIRESEVKKKHLRRWIMGKLWVLTCLLAYGNV